MDTSSCIVTPPQAKYGWFIFSFLIRGMNLIRISSFFCLFVIFCSFLFNGKGVQGRNNVSMVCLVLLGVIFLLIYIQSMMF